MGTVITFEKKEPKSPLAALIGSNSTEETTGNMVVGQRVRSDYDGKRGTIVEKDGFGWIVIYDDGSMRHNQQPGCLSPIPRIQALDEPIVPADSIASLHELHPQWKMDQNEKRDQEDADKNAAYKRAVAELRAQYPKALPADCGKSGQARAAANVRMELAAHFPGIKFSVTSDSASMTSSVSVKWVFGPACKDVDAIVGKYAYGTFDGMTDCAGIDKSSYGEAVSTVLGRVRFTSTNREFSDEFVRQVCQDIAQLLGMEFQSESDIDPVTRNNNYLISLSEYAYSALRKASFASNGPTGYAGVREATDEEEYNTGRDRFRIIINAEPASTAAVPTEPATASNAGVTIRHNQEKNGIEISFDAKPDASILTALKNQGFRWSKFQKIWYARYTDALFTFAQGLLPQEPAAEPAQEAPSTKVKLRTYTIGDRTEECACPTCGGPLDNGDTAIEIQDAEGWPIDAGFCSHLCAQDAIEKRNLTV